MKTIEQMLQELEQKKATFAAKMDKKIKSLEIKGDKR